LLALLSFGVLLLHSRSTFSLCILVLPVIASTNTHLIITLLSELLDLLDARTAAPLDRALEAGDRGVCAGFCCC
jgi:hypothetical protein